MGADSAYKIAYIYTTKLYIWRRNGNQQKQISKDSFIICLLYKGPEFWSAFILMQSNYLNFEFNIVPHSKIEVQKFLSRFFFLIIDISFLLFKTNAN